MSLEDAIKVLRQNGYRVHATVSTPHNKRAILVTINATMEEISERVAINKAEEILKFNEGYTQESMDFYENNGVGLDSYVNWLRHNGWDKAEQILPHDVQVRELQFSI